MKDDIVARFAEAVKAKVYPPVAELMADEVVVETPRHTIVGRERWLEVMTAPRPPDAGQLDHLDLVERDPVVEQTPEGAIVLIPQEFRWKETGELAYERALVLTLTIADDAITALKVDPGGGP